MATHVPTRVGIFAPYGWDEVSQMAITLAEMISRFGLHTSYLPSQVTLTDPVSESVHHRWDLHALTAKDQPFAEWLGSGLTHAVWFDIHPKKLKAAKAKGIKNILVAMQHNLNDEDTPFYREFDTIVCPCRAAYDLLRRKAHVPKAKVIPWDCGLALGSRMNAPVHKGERRLLIHTDRPMLEAYGKQVYQVALSFLERDPRGKVVINRTANLDNATQTMCDKIKAKHTGRFMDMMRLCALERADAAEVSDWVWCATLRDNAAAFALEFLTLGRPVMVFDTAPANEVVMHLNNGVIIPCKSSVAANGALSASMLLAQCTHSVCETVYNWENFNTCYSHEWTSLEARKRTFQEEWRQLVSRDNGDSLDM